MVRHSASEVGIETVIGRHTFRATDITDYMKNRGRVEVALHMPATPNAKTTSPLRRAQR
jgi:hypothetical protein